MKHKERKYIVNNVNPKWLIVLMICELIWWGGGGGINLSLCSGHAISCQRCRCYIISQLFFDYLSLLKNICHVPELSDYVSVCYGLVKYPLL